MTYLQHKTKKFKTFAVSVLNLTYDWSGIKSILLFEKECNSYCTETQHMSPPPHPSSISKDPKFIQHV